MRLSRHAAETLIKPQNSHRSTFAGKQREVHLKQHTAGGTVLSPVHIHLEPKFLCLLDLSCYTVTGVLYQRSVIFPDQCTWEVLLL